MIPSCVCVCACRASAPTTAALQYRPPDASDRVREYLATFFGLCVDGPAVTMVSECMVDVHTAKGRGKGMSPVEFALQGARVAGEVPALVDLKCQLGYVLTKVANACGRAMGWGGRV